MRLLAGRVRAAVFLSLVTVSIVIGPGRPGHFVPDALHRLLTAAWQVARPAAFAEVD